MIEISVTIIGIVLAFVLLRWSIKLYKKDHLKSGNMLIVICALLFFGSVPWFQGWVKAIFSTSIIPRVIALGDRVNVIQQTTDEMQKQLDVHQSQISSNQISLGEAQKKIEEEQKKLNDVEYLVNNLFSKMEYESIDGSETNKFFVTKYTSTNNIVIFKLKHVSLKNSVHAVVSSVFIGGTMISLGTLSQYENLAYTGVNSDLNLKGLHYEIQYARDDRKTNTVNAVEIRGDSVYLDGKETLTYKAGAGDFIITGTTNSANGSK